MAREELLRLGQTVRRARTVAGLTQEQLGQPRLSKSFISQLEQGIVSPSLASLFHICDKIGIRPAQLLGVADKTQWAVTGLDMAEAALVLDGIGAGNVWIQRLESVILVRQLEEHGLDHRWQRYVGIQRLLQGQTAAAIALFEAALREVPVVPSEMAGQTHEGAPGGPDRPLADDHVTKFWLGAAHQRAGHVLQALRVWERLLGFTTTGLLVTATWIYLSHLYDAIGDEAEARRARERIEETSHEQACLQVGPQLARLLWQVGETACETGDLSAASAHVRLIPVLLSRHLVPTGPMDDVQETAHA